MDRSVSRQWGVLVGAFVALAGVLVAVGPLPEGPAVLPPATEAPGRRFGRFVVSDDAAGWRQIRGDDGQRLVLPAPPRRIVSQSLGSDAVLLAICAPERIAAVSKLAFDPKYSGVVEAAQRLGRMATDNAEQVLALRPDLVLAASYTSEELLAQLSAAGAPMLRLVAFESARDIRDNMRLLGACVGEDEAAEALVAEMDARIARAARWAGAVPPRVVCHDHGAVLAGGTTLDDALRLAGAVNIATEQGLHKWPAVSAEQVAAWDPDAIVIGAEPGREDETIRAYLQAHPAIAHTRAARRIVTVPLPLMTTVSQEFATLVEHLARALHRP